MKYSKFEIFISKARLDRFLAACGGSQERALELYKAHLLISQAFYPVLNLFEIFLRNSINRNLISHFQDADWIRNQKNGFMSDPNLARSRFYLRESISNAETKLARRGTKITAGRLVAEQSFGFWTSLFEPHHYKLVQGSIIKCFPLKPAVVRRSTIAIQLRDIRDFRNRVYHNEPICFNRNIINFNTALKIHADIYNLLAWIDSELPSYILYYDKIDKRITAAQKI